MNSILKQRTLLLLLAGFVALGLAACGEEDDDNGITPTETTGTVCQASTAAADCGGFACAITEGEDEGICLTTCANDDQCAEGHSCVEVPGDEEGEMVMSCLVAGDSTLPPEPFIYIGVESTTTDPEGSTPGPNVDAIEIVRNGTSTFAMSVDANMFVQGSGNAEPATNSPDSALGTASNRTSFSGNQECALDVSDETYSLGATGGYIVVSFGGFEIEDGDVVRVWETSNPPCTNAPARSPGDTYQIFVGRADSLADRFGGEGWILVGGVEAPGAMPFTIDLPDAE